ncbi:MAG: prenyltransferase/squalene oxidase repeat-containing protein [Phycisphaerales bacterium JB039]
MIRATAIALTLCAAVPCLAQEQRPGAENNALEDEITPALDGAVNRGLAWLATQQHEDGSFGEGGWGRNVAVTSLAAIAFMADGNLPGRGQYGPVVEKALRYVMENTSESGLLAGEGAPSPMYGHGFAALFLGEVYGMTGGGPDTAEAARLHETLVKAVRLIERSQNDQGGWRYNPIPTDADVSVTICQVMALRSARSAGLEVSKETIDNAVEYVRKSQNPDGGFRYQMDRGGMSAWPRSAAGVATLFYAGVYEDEAIDKGLAYLHDEATPQKTQSQPHYFYGHYYAVQTMYLAGGEHWARWWPDMREELIDQQRPEGAWADRSIGSTYGTAMALIILQMPKRYLPIFQK